MWLGLDLQNRCFISFMIEVHFLICRKKNMGNQSKQAITCNNLTSFLNCTKNLLTKLQTLISAKCGSAYITKSMFHQFNHWRTFSFFKNYGKSKQASYYLQQFDEFFEWQAWNDCSKNNLLTFQNWWSSFISKHSTC